MHNRRRRSHVGGHPDRISSRDLVDGHPGHRRSHSRCGTNAAGAGRHLALGRPAPAELQLGAGGRGGRPRRRRVRGACQRHVGRVLQPRGPRPGRAERDQRHRWRLPDRLGVSRSVDQRQGHVPADPRHVRRAGAQLPGPSLVGRRLHGDPRRSLGTGPGLRGHPVHRQWRDQPPARLDQCDLRLLAGEPGCGLPAQRSTAGRRHRGRPVHQRVAPPVGHLPADLPDRAFGDLRWHALQHGHVAPAGHARCPVPGGA